jgi:copper chaperone CopZ
VEKTAKEIEGVKAAKVDQRKGEAVITYDASKTTPETIARIITKKTGFVSEVAPRK